MEKHDNSWVERLGFILLGVVFVTLKLLGVIDWSWWWVTLPFWFGIAIFLIVFLLGLLGIAISSVVDKLDR